MTTPKPEYADWTGCLLSVTEAARELDVSRREVARWIRNGWLGVTKLENGHRRVVDWEAMDVYTEVRKGRMKERVERGRRHRSVKRAKQPVKLPVEMQARYLTVGETARLFHVRVSTVHYWIGRERLRTVASASGMIAVDRESVVAWRRVWRLRTGRR